jgi:elongation factor Ts
MSEITSQLVKTLRDKTNAGMMDCKRALAEVGGDLEKAEDLLRKKGILKAGSKSSRATKEGVIASYIHMQGKVGVLVEINCETDFVAKNEAFRDFVKDITLHIAASSPICVSRDQVPAELVARERAVAIAQIEEEGKKSGKSKPANIVEKIVDGKIDKFLAGLSLLDQPFIKNPDQTVEELLKSKIAELGENMVIRRFTRYMVGEVIEAEKATE